MHPVTHGDRVVVSAGMGDYDTGVLLETEGSMSLVRFDTGGTAWVTSTAVRPTDDVSRPTTHESSSTSNDTNASKGTN